MKEKILANDNWSIKVHVGTGVFAFVTTCVFAYLNYLVLGRTVGMWSNNYGNLLYFLGGAVSGIISTVCLSKCVKNKVIEYIGKNSIFYYGMHIVLLEIGAYVTQYIPGISYDIIAFTVSTAFVIVVLAVLNQLCPLYMKVLRYINSMIR